jgi:hypothetical protein
MNNTTCPHTISRDRQRRCVYERDGEREREREREREGGEREHNIEREREREERENITLRERESIRVMHKRRRRARTEFVADNGQHNVLGTHLLQLSHPHLQRIQRVLAR